MPLSSDSQSNRESQGEVASPCISVCALDENDLCLGCLRNLSEIATWAQMSAVEKQDVLRQIEERREARESGSV